MLLVDIGNTRLKAGLASGANVRELPGMATRDSASFAHWCARIANDANPARVLVSNVAGPEVAGAFGQCVFEQWHVEAEFLRPRREFAGVVTRYEDPEQLGVDRWLAALAAFRRTGAAVCVVDAGTAVTVDIVDDGGVHLGGLIAPGMELMRLSLKHGTAQLESTAVEPIDVFATNTRDAISLGCRDASRGLLASVHARLLAAFPEGAFAWYLTGGGAAAIRDLMPAEHVFAPDLVLHGLAVAGAQP